MLDIAAELGEWCRQDREFAVATLVTVDGSAPRQPGAALAVDRAGTAVGSVSGGCVEGAVYELCREALASGEPALARFGPGTDDPFAAQLTCGGTVDLLVTPVTAAARPPVAAALAEAAAGRPVALAYAVDGPPGVLGRPLLVRPDGSRLGTLGGGEALDRAAAGRARTLPGAGRRTARIVVGPRESGCPRPVTLFVECSVPAPRLLVFGAIDFAAALTRVGAFLGYRVTVCDARAVFATAARFPDADEVVVDWPHRYLRSTEVDERTAICVLTHDPKFDLPLLEHALTLPVAYVGAMGSRRTHAERRQRLLAAGVDERLLARLRSPIGLDLGARTPEETALSIGAEIVAARHGGTGRPLSETADPIHKDGPAAESCSAFDTPGPLAPARVA
ncbi:XdhC family protein [Kitasatospora sp. NPDC059646]|uniref:XdhC family protein n=1 Tax=Kitasatospora sp. NPDC059646 TaxID=3346893 RepID=UPI00369A9B18